MAKTDSVAIIDASLWQEIQPHIEENNQDSSFLLIRKIVQEKCNYDTACLLVNYPKLIHKLERVFNLPAAIYFGDELIKIAHQQNNAEIEARAHIDQYRFYNALGMEQKAISHLDKALAFYQSVGDQYIITHLKMYKLQGSLDYLTLEEVLPEMNKLLTESINNRDTSSMIYMHGLLIRYDFNAKHYIESANHIAELEKLLSDYYPIGGNSSLEIKINIGKADLALLDDDLIRAEKYFKQALINCREVPDRWREIDVLHSLAQIAWKLGNSARAKTYLKEAKEKAESLNLHELLSVNYRLRSAIAEEEHRYSDALGFIKKQHYHDSIFKNKSAGFDVRRHYLQSEKDKLLMAGEKNELELKIKNIQLRNFRVIAGLILLLATGLIIGLYKQRKGKKELAGQNKLIHKQAEKLKTLDESKSRFFANVSHELRTPLTLVLGPIDSLLKDKQLTQRQAQLLKLAKQNSKHLGQLVNEILDLRKLEMGKLELNKEPTVLTTYFNRYLTQFESMAQRKQIEYSYDVSLVENCVAELDAEKFRQVIYNLISNAFKFTPIAGSIKIRITINDKKLLLEVADSGAGIHPDDLPHVFDRFYQTSRPKAPAAGGTGIGLALCKEYANLFGGEVSVKSELGKGTRFRFEFPIDEVDNAQFAEIYDDGHKDEPIIDELIHTIDSEESSKTKPSILMVEDNLVLQEYVSLILEDKYNISTVDNGQLALDYLAENAKCDLIISDLMMPVMDGYQLLENLKSSKTTQHIPVIMLTARAEVSDKLTALRIGVDDYLTKPFNEEELKVRIQNLLKNQHVRNVSREEDEKTSPDTPPIFSWPDKKWLDRFESFVKDHFADDTLGVSVLTEEFAMSESTLLRQVKRLIGLSPNQYIKELRLDRARLFLENHQYNSIKTIALKVGYNDVRTFSRSFRKRYGKSPSEFLENDFL